MGERIVLAGSVAGLPGRGGHTWVFLQYLLGLRRLGWDVTFVDWLEPAMCRGGAAVAASANWRYLRRVMDGFGLAGHYALVDRSTGAVLGMSRSALLERVRSAAALINVMGFLGDADLLAAAGKRVFLDLDPGFPQMWRALELADVFAGHDAFVTVGRRVGAGADAIPTCGLEWIDTAQPVVLEQWPVSPARPGRFAGIGSWRGANGPLTYGGVTYGLRVHEFRRFFELPRRVGGRFELALDIHPDEANDLARLRAGGWCLRRPSVVAGDPWAYREYIAAQGAEFAVAKGMYVQTRGGWFSDRSICFLAAGRPVLAQDTGIRGLYPTGEGLLTFATLEEACAGAEELTRDGARHARAARALAEAYFDSDHVLTTLLGRLALT